MRKKIILFCCGLLAAVLGLIAYQYFTGAPMFFTNKTKEPPSIDANMGPGAAHPYLEIRDDTNGLLQCVLSADRSIPKGGGIYQITNPKGTWYIGDGRVLAITADEAMIQIDQSGTKSSPKILPKGGTLSGNVCLTVGPKETFVPNSKKLQPGQIQVALDHDLLFDYTDRLLSSDGKVSVHGDVQYGGSSHEVSFDGKDLKVLVKTNQRRIDGIELLRIEEGTTITIKGVGDQAGSLLGTPATTPGTAAANLSAAPVAAPQIAAAATIPSAQAALDRQRTTYKLNFGSNVKAAVGDSWMTSQTLQLIFQLAAGEVSRNIGVAPTTTSAGVPAPAVNTTQLVKHPVPPAGVGQDLVITWSGPMEVRPTTPTDASLTGPKDAIIEAIGTDTIPVVLHDAAGRGAHAHRVFYHTGPQMAQLDAGPNQPVELFDAAMGKLQCLGMTLQQATGKLQFIGPGRFEAVEGSTQKPGTTIAVANKGPVIGYWGKMLDLELQTVADVKNPGKKTQVVRRAILTGSADVQDPSSRIQCDTLDVQVARGGDAKSSQVLEHVLATGNVMVRSAKAPGVVANDEDPSADSLHCQQLEVKTAAPAGSTVPQPSEVLATGDVQAVAHQVDKNNPKKVVRQQIDTPRMLVSLEPKNVAAVNAPHEGIGGFGVQQMQAFDGVKVQIEGLGPQMVLANAQTLVADPKASTARLEGGDATLGRAAWASVRQGSNSLSGQSILLQQKIQSAQIPGTGEFIFLQPSNKANEAPSPVKVTWANSMDYNGKDLVAHFAGGVVAQLLGKPEQESKLNCDNLEVKMASITAPNVTATRSANADVAGLDDDVAHKIRLAQVTASGNVTALGTTLDKNGKLLERMYMRAPVLIYEESQKTLRVLRPGDLLLEDYRPVTVAGPVDTSGDLAGGAGGMRGQTAFRWGDSLTYSGDTGLIHMKKDVFMRHMPEKLVVPAKPNAIPDPKSSEIQMQCQDLLTELIQSKGPVSNPIALGTAGQTKVGKVTADGGSIMTMGNVKLAADALEYNAPKNLASAYGRNGNFATVIRPEGTASADRIDWDLTKGSGGITLIGPQGQLIAP